MAKSKSTESVPETLPSPSMPARCKYGFGYRRDTHDTSKDQTTRHLLGALIGSLPAEALDMEQFITGAFSVKNQKESSECVAFALARCAQLRCALQGTPLKEWLSTTCMYTVGRAKERAAEGETPETQPLQDQGSIPKMVVDGANDLGVCTDSQWPFSDDPAKLNAEPDPEKLIAASAMKFTGYYRIATTGAQRAQDVMQALARGYPVLIGVAVDQAFADYAGGIAEAKVTPPIPNAVNAPVPDDSLPQRFLGFHALCLFGYKTFANGLVLFRGCNSWDETWGDYGLFWASMAWLTDENVMDILVIAFDPSHHAVAA